MTDPIERFTGAYRFLSNFYPADVTLSAQMTAYALPGVVESQWYPSVEHAYQAAKVLDATTARSFLTGTAGEAKRRGRKVAIRPDWERVKLGVMLELLRQKFKSSPKLYTALLRTGDALLEEGNDWGDTFWGVCQGEGQNHLGRLLMQVRGELRANVNQGEDRERRVRVLDRIAEAWDRTPPGTSIGVVLSVWLDGVSDAALDALPEEELLAELDASIGDCEWHDTSAVFDAQVAGARG